MSPDEVNGRSRGQRIKYLLIGDLPFEVWQAKFGKLSAYGTSEQAAAVNLTNLIDAQVSK